MNLRLAYLTLVIFALLLQPLRPARAEKLIEEADIQLRQARTQAENARNERDPAKREQMTAAAAAALQAWIAKNPKHEGLLDARRELGLALVELARMQIAQGKKSKSEAGRKEKLAAASKRLDEARAVYAQIKLDIEAELQMIGNVPAEPDPEIIDRRDLLRGYYVETLLIHAHVLYDQAATFTDDKAARETCLREAAKSFHDVWQRYRTRLAGLYAKMFEGRCYQDLATEQGYADALRIYEELLESPDNPQPFTLLKTKVLKLAMECWLVTKEPLTAVKRGEEWLARAKPKPAELKFEDWVAYHRVLAEAHKQLADSLPAGDPKKAEHRDRAKELGDI